MTPCAVCGQPGEPLKAMRLDGQPAPSPGAACSPPCASLLSVGRAVMGGGDKHLEAWRWRQRRADVRGTPSIERKPLEPDERAFQLLLASRPKWAAYWQELTGGSK